MKDSPELDCKAYELENLSLLDWLL
ncbi:uncharacterized protein METZ01_LOCUS197380, partial [marine metagenome]